MEIFKRYRFLFFIVVLTSIFGCGGKGYDQKKRAVDIIRYDRLIFGIEKSNIKREFEAIKTDFPAMTDIYFGKVLEMPGYKTNDSIFYKELKTFITDSSMVNLFDLCEKEFGEMDEIKLEFANIFAKAKKMYSGIEIPKVYSCISGFAIQRFLFNDNSGEALAFSLDMFLGDRFDYSRLERGQGTFSDYFVRTYNKDYLVKKVLELWLEDVIGSDDNERAIDKMINKGKKIFFIKQLMPDIQDTILLDYSKEQLEWLKNNEQELWSYMIKKNLFYTTSDYEIKRLISPGPNSQALGMPRKSPGMTGVYIGYRIVSSYMNRYREKTIEDLLKDKNAQKIMSKSGFKPKRRS